MINLIPHNPIWFKVFQQEQKLLLNLDEVIAVEHIGSTAIPGIMAKPIIDMMVGVNSLDKADRHLIESIELLGYGVF